MRSPRLAVATAAALLGLFPLAAHAALPEPATNSIAPGKSIGGVKIGGTLEEARQAWGADSGRCTSSSCSYRTEGDSRGDKGDAYFATDDGGQAISVVWIAAPGHNGKNPKFTGPLVKLKTSKGIRLGSKLTAVRKAYKKAMRSNAVNWTLKSGNSKTVFTFKNDRVSKILIQQNR